MSSCAAAFLAPELVPLSQLMSRLLRHSTRWDDVLDMDADRWVQLQDLMRVPDMLPWTDDDVEKVVRGSQRGGAPRFEVSTSQLGVPIIRATHGHTRPCPSSRVPSGGRALGRQRHRGGRALGRLAVRVVVRRPPHQVPTAPVSSALQAHRTQGPTSSCTRGPRPVPAHGGRALCRPRLVCLSTRLRNGTGQHSAGTFPRKHRHHICSRSAKGGSPCRMFLRTPSLRGPEAIAAPWTCRVSPCRAPRLCRTMTS